MDLTKPDPRSPAARRAQQRGESHFSATSAETTAQTSDLSRQVPAHATATAGPANRTAAHVNKNALTVSQLNREAKLILEHGLPNICVEGEISNLARPASGHWYFTLKDSRAQIRCAMFKQRNRLIRPAPQEGDKVQIRGKLTLYEARGDYQLIAEGMEAAGEGALRQAYEALRLKLEQEGLFDSSRKQALPAWPGKIAVITSPTGAAVRDVIDVLGRRYPAGEVLIYPTSVQGDHAPLEIRKALHNAIQQANADVIVIGRGGGSLEDLWAFNDEALARDVAACPVPIVSAVGHETDFSLCDFVADLRAPTPSAAAELVSPQTDDWLAWLTNNQQRLVRHAQSCLEREQQRLDQQSHRLLQQHPLRRLEPFSQKLNNLNAQLKQTIQQRVQQAQAKSTALQLRLTSQSPSSKLAQQANRLNLSRQRLLQQGNLLTQQPQRRLSELAGKLEVVSPLATLQRGYAIATSESGRTITDASKTQAGDKINVKLAVGELACRVE